MHSLKRLPLALATTACIGALAACSTAPQIAAAPQPPQAPLVAAPAEPAPVPALISQVAIPHQEFQLDNGLTVLVHTDRKAPVVAVAMWYNVGSKDEPKGKTGFAHLFEHLMFNGSENLPEDYFQYLQEIGATDYNGTTNFDRTNYFQTVPAGALERALFLESDRMGYLLGAVTQAKLDNQRGVVQNEKRQGDNQPGGLVFYEILENLFPEGHPYRHSPIGSMADLDAASLQDVRDWFQDKYGPNNAVLVLAGDIDAAAARPLVEKYFGEIPRGPVNVPSAAEIPVLDAPKSSVMKDRVAAVTVSRYWPMPGILDRELVALDVGGSVLGGLASSRLDRILVREEKTAVSVTAGLYPQQRVGIFFAQATVKPGVDPALVEQRLDEIVAEYVANGPTEDEVRRAATQEVSGRIRGLEQVGGFGGKAVTLAHGEVLAGDSEFYRRTLANYATVTPAEIRSAMAQWLAKPAFSLRLEPGERPPYEEAQAVAAAPKKGSDKITVTKKREIPPLGPMPPLDFPDVSHVTLSNGVQLHYAQRSAVPVTQLALVFDAGYAADAPVDRGLQNLTMTLLDEGTANLGSQEVAEAKERLGVDIGTRGTADRSMVTMSALSANLAPSLGLLADIVRNPAFAPAELERVRTQVLTAIAQQLKDPNSMAARALPALLYGETHPYATTTIGQADAVQRFTRDDLLRFQQQWLRPDNLEIFVVSDQPLAVVQAELEARFGQWQPPAVQRGVKQFTAPPERPAQPRIVLIDRPQSPQSVIMAGQLTPVDPRSDVTALASANDVIGGNFLARINMDLRETKGWSYGVRGSLALNEQSVPYVVRAPVQADKTGPSIATLTEIYEAYLTNLGTTQEELARIIANNIQELPGQFETSSAVLQAMMTNDLLGRPDNYYEQLADKYRVQSQVTLDQAARAAISPVGFTWVVVGDAAVIRPQLEKLGMPIEVIEPR
ncbi:MAG TPA: pitrilysin family protein [Sphingomicrobium sp.]|nr:pitrilysin family protein [Sphingomicrobium sp.]